MLSVFQFFSILALITFWRIQQMREFSERVVGGGWSFLPVRVLGGQPLGVQVAGVFIVVAVEAQHLPVAAVGWIVIGIMVFVMHCQFAQFFAGKIAAATGADPWQDL